MYKGNFENNFNFENKDNNDTFEHRNNLENIECQEPPRYCCEEKKCVLRPNRTFMKCSVPVTTNIPMTTASGTTFNLANLNIDTSKFHKPCIKFEFTSNILTAAGSLTFNFQINKQCKYQPTAFPIGPVWTFSRLASSVGENDTFNFSVCDCDICDDDCCNFIVVVTIESLETQGGITVNNATLSAIVVDNPFC